MYEIIGEEKEERVILNQNNYNMFLRSTYYSRWFNEESFDKNASSLDKIKLGEYYFTNAINRDKVFVDYNFNEGRPIILKIK